MWNICLSGVQHPWARLPKCQWCFLEVATPNLPRNMLPSSPVRIFAERQGTVASNTVCASVSAPAVLCLPVFLRDAPGHPRYGGWIYQLWGHRHELPRLPHHSETPHQGRAPPCTGLGCMCTQLTYFAVVRCVTHRTSESSSVKWDDEATSQIGSLQGLMRVFTFSGVNG